MDPFAPYFLISWCIGFWKSRVWQRPCESSVMNYGLSTWTQTTRWPSLNFFSSPIRRHLHKCFLQSLATISLPSWRKPYDSTRQSLRRRRKRSAGLGHLAWKRRPTSLFSVCVCLSLSLTQSFLFICYFPGQLLGGDDEGAWGESCLWRRQGQGRAETHARRGPGRPCEYGMCGVRLFKHTHAYMREYIHIHIHTYIYIYIHTYTSRISVPP